MKKPRIFAGDDVQPGVVSGYDFFANFILVVDGAGGKRSIVSN